MKPKEIVVGGVYEGDSVISLREVDHIINGDKLHWFCVFPVRIMGGRVIHTPNRVCLVKTFAKWATKCIDEVKP